MKNIITLVTLLLIVGLGNSQNNEKRIKFNKGTLKICSSANMKIMGYDGDEVIIKSLDNNFKVKGFYNLGGQNDKVKFINDSLVSTSYRLLYTTGQNGKTKKDLEKGLKPLGNKSANPADNLYLDITVNPGELIIKDYDYSLSDKSKVDGFAYYIKDKKRNSKKNVTTQFNSFLRKNNKYELLIPNSIKLSWNVENCAKKNSNTFFVSSESKPWELSNFNGEVEVSASYNSISLTDIGGPVIANTIGGNITVVFDKVTPNKLYSLISNDGYIDVTLPQNANINVDAIGDRILSDIDFKVLNETLINGTKGMELELNSGKTKMKLDAGSGSVYLRKG